MIVNPLADALIAILALMTVLWLVSIYVQDVSIVDLFWGPAIALGGFVYWLEQSPAVMRANLVLVAALLWAARLGIYLYLRNAGKPEDRRYRDMRERNAPGFEYKSIYLVFGLQGVLAWVVGLPLYGGIVSSAPLNWLDALGFSLFAFGLIWESVADFQLARFLSSRQNTDAVMDSGLWRYSRHPNYFGEFCLWWGLWLVAAAAGAAWTIVGPILLSLFLFKVSGVALLEKDISGRRPAYQAYIDRTSAFFPLPPRD